jgi:hypothetical protein
LAQKIRGPQRYAALDESIRSMTKIVIEREIAPRRSKGLRVPMIAVRTMAIDGKNIYKE